MADLPIHWIAARVHAHATEDEGRVAHALDEACPGPPPERDLLEGQYGNRLVVLSRTVAKHRGVATVWDRWARAGVLRSLRAALPSRLDSEGVLHFRLDKQKAYEGVLVLAETTDTIDIQVRLKAYPARIEAIRRIAQDLTEAD